MGNLLVVAAAVCWSVYASLQKRMNREAESYTVLLGVFAVSAVITLPVWWGEGVSWPGWVAVGAVDYLAFNTLAAYGAFAESLQHLEAGTVAGVTAFAPIVTVGITRALVVAQPEAVPPGSLTVWTLAGATPAVVGVALVVRGERKGRPPRGAPPE